jgi:2-hydroxy-6-oxo-octa-2,4-dienoate hydrolase
MSAASTPHPAIGRSIVAAGIRTNYHDVGEGPPVVLLHGSGAGVSGWENWHRLMPVLAREYRVLVPDIVGFGYTERPADTRYGIKLWVQHLLGFLDALGIERAALVGNSFGGALSLATAIRNGHRVTRMVLMGTPAGEFEQAEAAARSWYYTPSLENMRELLMTFPYDPSVVTDEMVRLRHQTTVDAGGLEAYRKLFPEPGQPGQKKIVRGIPETDLAAIMVPVLAIHGREDSRVPLECSLRIVRHCTDAELHVFGRCGHWVQIERADAFARLTRSFLAPLRD